MTQYASTGLITPIYQTWFRLQCFKFQAPPGLPVHNSDGVNKMHLTVWCDKAHTGMSGLLLAGINQACQ